MHPARHAARDPDRPAVIVAETGEAFSYADLDAASNRAAQAFRALGLVAGDRVAMLVGNVPDWFGIAWGAQRSGLLLVTVSTKLTSGEVDYILADSGAKLLIADAALADIAIDLATPTLRYAVCGTVDGFDDWAALVATQSPTPVADETAGQAMLYSSGTTGRPKGIMPPAPADAAIDAVTPLVTIAQRIFGLDAQTVYLSTAPLYHAAPLGWTMAVHRLGGTVVLMNRFDAEASLAHIARYRCNAGQFVPTHFVRMLKLTQATRDHYDVSSMKVAIHAAAPCPVPVKQAMIDWWGPVIDEYYAGSEANGFTAIKAADWLTHPGSVGRAVGEAKLHICDDESNEQPPRTEGGVYFEGPRLFDYHNDAAKTAKSRNRHGWTTLGDVGWVDEEGYLYLTDRKSFMIISGGVNIYPQEIENLLITHPAVADCAVIGAPHDEMGEQVVAVVQLAGPACADELDAFCRAHLSGVKVPRRFDFVDELPRHDTGKLYKRLLRDTYWSPA